MPQTSPNDQVADVPNDKPAAPASFAFDWPETSKARVTVARDNDVAVSNGREASMRWTMEHDLEVKKEGEGGRWMGLSVDINGVFIGVVDWDGFDTRVRDALHAVHQKFPLNITVADQVGQLKNQPSGYRMVCRVHLSARYRRDE